MTEVKSSQGVCAYLHPGLHHIQRCVSKDTGRPRRCSKHRCDNWVHFSSRIVTFDAKVKGNRRKRINQLDRKRQMWTLDIVL